MTNMTAIRITTQGEVSTLDMTTDSLQTLQTAVGGWVQAIDLSADMTVWCNEEGKLIGLPHNPYAQHLWDQAFGAQTDYLVGDIVLTGGTDEEGMTLGLTAEQEQTIRNMVAKVNEYTQPRATVVF